MAKLLAWILALGLSVSSAGAAATDGKSMILEAKDLAGLTWNLDVSYVATTNDLSCKYANSITGLWDAQTVTERVAPASEGTRMRAVVPLAPGGQEAFCSWELSSVALCPANANGEGRACTTLFVVRSRAEPLPRSMELTCDVERASCASPTSYPASYALPADAQPVLELKLRPIAD